jgi:putative tryptophan/tyrosine transport system substrate-binding protein
MKGRQIILSVFLALAILMEPCGSEAQQRGKVYRIGYLAIAPGDYERDSRNCPKVGNLYWQAFLEGLREHGYLQGQNLALECRWTEGQGDRALSLSAELVSFKPDLIIVIGTTQVRAAKQATSRIPIVMAGVIDPVGRGLVDSLARPGGNVTGVADTLPEMEGKRLQLLKEAVPNLSRVGILDPGGPDKDSWKSRYLDHAAQALGLKLQVYAAEGKEFAQAFAAMTKAGEEALFVEPTPLFNTGDRPQRIAELAAQHRLPSIYQDRRFVDAGGLMSYSTDSLADLRRIGIYVDKILNGANPGNLPVEQPTSFKLIINLKTAETLGLTIPPALLILADEVMQ